MTVADRDLPRFYHDVLRTLLRYAIVMAIVGLLAGISFQESARKLSYVAAPGGVRLEAIVQLALVHGHVFTMTVLLPLGLAGALLLARRVGAPAISLRGLRCLTRGYLPFATATVALQLYKGYFVLLAVRGGTLDFAAIDAAFLGGAGVVRYGVYGFVHTGMGISLGAFLVLLWRSLTRPLASA